MKMRYSVFCIALCICLSSCSLIDKFAPTSSQEQSVHDEVFTEKYDIFSRFYNTDGERADQLFEEIIRALEEENEEALKEWFSVSTCNAEEDFDESIHALLTFYDGSKVSYRRFGPGSSAAKEGNAERKEIEASYDITTTTAVYRMAIKFCTVDTENPDNIGVTSLYITKAENSDMNFAYWGSSEMNVGIHIEQPSLPEQEDSAENTLVEQLDEEYKAAINAAISNVEICEANQRFAEEWKKIIEEYYTLLLDTNTEALGVHIEKDKKEWPQYAQTRIDLKLEYLQQVYSTGSIVPVIQSQFICEIHREKAIELMEMYSQLQAIND